MTAWHTAAKPTFYTQKAQYVLCSANVLISRNNTLEVSTLDLFELLSRHMSVNFTVEKKAKEDKLRRESTFDDVLSGESSLCLCSAGLEKNMSASFSPSDGLNDECFWLNMNVFSPLASNLLSSPVDFCCDDKTGAPGEDVGSTVNHTDNLLFSYWDYWHDVQSD